MIKTELGGEIKLGAIRLREIGTEDKESGFWQLVVSSSGSILNSTSIPFRFRVVSVRGVSCAQEYGLSSTGLLLSLSDAPFSLISPRD